MTDRALILHPSVEADLESIAAYYAQRDPGLPARFLARLGEQLELLGVFPEAGTPYFDGYRRVLLRRFPFMAVYRTDEELAMWKSRDPIPTFTTFLQARNVLSDETLQETERRVKATIDEAVEFAMRAPDPQPEEAAIQRFVALQEFDVGDLELDQRLVLDRWRSHRRRGLLFGHGLFATNGQQAEQCTCKNSFAQHYFLPENALFTTFVVYCEFELNSQS